MKTKVVRKPDARSRQPTTKNKQSKDKTFDTKQEEGKSAPSTDEGEWRKRRKVVKPIGSGNAGDEEEEERRWG